MNHRLARTAETVITGTWPSTRPRPATWAGLRHLGNPHRHLWRPCDPPWTRTPYYYKRQQLFLATCPLFSSFGVAHRHTSFGTTVWNGPGHGRGLPHPDGSTVAGRAARETTPYHVRACGIATQAFSYNRCPCWPWPPSPARHRSPGCGTPAPVSPRGWSLDREPPGPRRPVLPLAT